MFAEKVKIVSEEKEVVRIFNDHYINVIEGSSELNQSKLSKNSKLKTTKKQ